MDFQKYGGRRFILTAGTGIAATVLQACGKLDPAGTSYMGIIAATIAAYIAGDVTEKKHIVQAGGKPDTKTDT